MKRITIAEHVIKLSIDLSEDRDRPIGKIYFVTLSPLSIVLGVLLSTPLSPFTRSEDVYNQTIFVESVRCLLSITNYHVVAFICGCVP